MKIEIYPKVYKSDKRQKIFFKLDEESDGLSVKIQPMEKYGIPHKDFRIDESYRYSFEKLTKENENLYSFEYSFKGEQRYTIYIKRRDELLTKQYVYSVKEDFQAFLPFKGDTHLHSSRSDGEATPFEVSLAYRSLGFDFIAITDHHKMWPSIEAREKIEALTNYFTVFSGEEVHNKDMGYFHIVNFGGKSSVNTIIETDDNYVTLALEEIKKNTDFPENVCVDACAYRIFVANEIRRSGGLAVFAHPFWEDYGEYNAETDDVIFLLKNGYYDALEVLAGCDYTGNGNNLQEALWGELRAMGAKIPVLGASDTHRITKEPTKFNKQFSIVLSENAENIPASIKRELSVAVERRSGSDFRCIGRFRVAKYVRFLMEEYYPTYEILCEKHAKELAESEKTGNFEDLKLAEQKIDEFKAKFFAF